MRVVVCPSDRNAVGYYRLGLPAMTLSDQGENIHFEFLPGLPLNTIGNNQPTGLADQFFDLEPDVLVLQRPMAEWQLLGLRSAQKHGVKVVVELDDLFHAVDRRSAFGSQVKPHHLRTLDEICSEADLITVSTPALARRYAPHGRFVVLPNYVPESWLEIECCGCPQCDGSTRVVSECIRSEVPIVGWTGSIGSHVDDLRSTSRGLASLDAEFRCFGSGNEQARTMIRNAVGLNPEILPWQPRDQYPHEIAKLTIGIAPLADNAFNRAKSWLKPLEYAACGVPCVMSPTTEYLRIHNQYGIGRLAGFGYANQWKHETGRLLTDHTYRDELAEHGRQMVRDYLTIERNAYRWAEAWASCLEPTPIAA